MSYSSPTPPTAPKQSPLTWILGGLVVILAAALAVALLTRPPGDNSAAVTAALEASAAATPAVASPATKAAAVNAGQVKLKIGQAHSFTASDGDQATVTVLNHRADRGNGYGIQVRTCNRGAGAFSASTRPWMLSFGGGEELSEVQIVGGGLLAPAFTEGSLNPGKCRKGWITFEAAGAPDGAEYRIEGETSARWEW